MAVHWLGPLLNLLSIWVLRTLLRFGSDRQTVVLGRRLKLLVRAALRSVTRAPSLATTVMAVTASVSSVLTIVGGVSRVGVCSVRATRLVWALTPCRWLFWCRVAWTRFGARSVLVVGSGVPVSTVNVLWSVTHC